MACSKHFNGYLGYKCYADIKNQFGEKIEKEDYSITERVSYFDEKYPPSKRENLNKLSNVYINLKKYLSNDHVFASSDYNKQATCNYISYLLYHGIRKNNNGDIDETKFNDFKDFVDKFNETTKSSVCVDMLKYLKSYEFRIRETLYELYDNYYILSGQNAQYRHYYCQDVLSLVGLYNSFLKEYPSNSLEFNDVLTEFKALMNKVTETAKKETKCKGLYFFTNEPELFVPEDVKINPPTITPLEPENRLSQQDTLHSAPHPKPEEVRSLSSTLGGEPERADHANSQRSEVSEQLEVEATFVSPKQVEREQTRQNLKDSEHVFFIPQASHELRRTYRPGSYYGKGKYFETKETDPLGENSVVEKEQLGLGPEKEHAGFMTNVQSAISGFMKDVDPVPVVGVSGGMGALFLLFRYTPVGAFFRGGRRMNNRIPSRFSGQILGGFPGYEEFYDGGFVNGPINISYRPELE